MELKVSKEKFVSIIIFIFTILIELCIANEYSFDSRDSLMTYYSWVVVMNIVLEIIILKACNERIISFFFFFVIFLYLFHFGQVLMEGIFVDYEYDYVNYIQYYMTNMESLQKSLNVSNLVTSFTFLGGLMATNNKFEPYKSSNALSDIADNEFIRLSVHSVAVLLCVGFLPFRLYIDVRQIIAAIGQGYFGAINVSVPGIFDSFASIWYVALILLYATTMNKKKKLYILLATIVYLGIKMLTGNRGHETVVLVSMFIIIIYQKGKMSLKKWLKYIVIVYVALIALDLVYSFRVQGISYFLSNWKILVSETTSNNILLETIGTFGETLYTPYLMFEQISMGVLKTEFMGTFLKSIVSIIPDAFGIFSKINDAAILGKIIKTSHAIGGSYVAELYYNFQGIYLLATTLLGMVWMKLSRRVEYAIQYERYDILAYSLPWLVHLLWWTRDSVGNYTRNVLWQILITWIILSILRKRSDMYGNQ